MARRKLSDVAKPDPIVYEDDAGNPIFTMPKRFRNLSQIERAQYEKVASEQMEKAQEIRQLLQDLEDEKQPDSARVEDLSRLNAEMSEARFLLLGKIIPEMTKDLFATLSDAVIAELISEFTSRDFQAPTEDPATSGSAAT